jgi:hypothetical protein
VLHALTAQPRRVFLLDGFGALLTAAGLLLVLMRFERSFGVPAGVIAPLAAVVFALYSLSCWAVYRQVGRRPRAFLVAIALANAGYCIVTWALAFAHRAEVTPLGFAYFAAESVIVTLVVTLELKTAARHATSTAP